jgi:hypothetical protein
MCVPRKQDTMSEVKVVLPAKIEVDDYHEFAYLQDKLRAVIPGIKVREIGFTSCYVGVAYLGRKTSPETADMIHKILADVKEWNRIDE